MPSAPPHYSVSRPAPRPEPRHRRARSSVLAYVPLSSPPRVPRSRGFGMHDWTRHSRSLTYPPIVGVSPRLDRPWGEPVVTESNDIAALTAVVLREEEDRREAQARAEAEE